MLLDRARPDAADVAARAAGAPSAARDALFAAINAQRTDRGLAAFLADPALDDMAQSWAGTMALTGTMTHGDFPGRITQFYPNSAAGEDIAEGAIDVPAVVDLWMGSLPHRAKILGDFNHMGVGIARSVGGDTFFVLDFDNH